MAYDLDQLAQDARSARGAATSLESTISKFAKGKIHDVEWTADQKSAALASAIAQLAALTASTAAIQAQVDAN
jgi:hypothetical protein